MHEFRFSLNSPSGDSLIIFEGIQISPGLGHPCYEPPVYAPPDFDPLVLLPFPSQITHNPFELMAYLTAVYGDFTNYDINTILREIFDTAFTLEIIEGTRVTAAMVRKLRYKHKHRKNPHNQQYHNNPHHTHYPHIYRNHHSRKFSTKKPKQQTNKRSKQRRRQRR